jgi:NAD(P)-dependent dehydrogenase (short-subunit alcohol dehydrogenase family)
MTGISNLVVAITGGGSGLGLGLARYMHKHKARLAILEIMPAKVAALRDYFGEAVLAVQGDVRSSADVAAFHDAVVSKFGGVDSLLGAQGIFDGNRRLKDIPLDQLDAAFDEIMQVNVRGYLTTAKVFRESLAKRNGSIVFTASPASYCADGGGILYTTSKHAVLGVVRQLALEFAPAVRVNAVAPCGIANSDLRGPQALGLQNESQNDIPKEGFMDMVRKMTLLNYLPTGEEYGPLYALLASPDSKTMTGEIVMADQGLMNRPIISVAR